MSDRSKDAAARRATSNLKRAVKAVPTELPRAVQAAANRRKPKP